MTVKIVTVSHRHLKENVGGGLFGGGRGGGAKSIESLDIFLIFIYISCVNYPKEDKLLVSQSKFSGTTCNPLGLDTQSICTPLVCPTCFYAFNLDMLK